MSKTTLHSVFDISRDGRFVVGEEALEDESGAAVVDIHTGNAIRLRGHEAQVADARFSPDGMFVVTTSYDGTIRVWERETGEEVQQVEEVDEPEPPGALAISPDDSGFVTTSYRRTIRLYSCDVCRPLEDLIRLAESRITRKFTSDERRKYLIDF